MQSSLSLNPVYGAVRCGGQGGGAYAREAEEQRGIASELQLVEDYQQFVLQTLLAPSAKRRAVRCSAGRMKGELHPFNNRMKGELHPAKNRS